MSKVDTALEKIGKHVDDTSKRFRDAMVPTEFNKPGSTFNDVWGKMTGSGEDQTGGKKKPGAQINTEQLLGAALGGGDVMGQVGGMIGEALGGPIGAIIGSKVGELVKKILEFIPKAIAAPAALAVSGLGLLDDSLKGLSGTLGPIGVGFDLVSKGMGTFADVFKKIPVVGQLLGPLVDQFVVVPGILKSMTESFVGFAAKAGPGQFKMFQMALEDVQGVLGQSFLPILKSDEGRHPLRGRRTRHCATQHA